MALFNISSFKANGLVYGGARPTLFDVDIAMPQSLGFGGVLASQRLKFTCSASSIPASTVGSVPVPYFGRTIKLAGDREFADWSVTILNDEDYVVRRALEAWSNALNTMESNLRRIPSLEYKKDGIVRAYSKNGGLISSYKFVGIFPTNVDAMDLSWDSTNSIQSFGVTFSYDYWVPTGEDVSGANGSDTFNGSEDVVTAF